MMEGDRDAEVPCQMVAVILGAARDLVLFVKNLCFIHKVGRIIRR